MTPITFITGNKDKAKYLESYLGYPIEHISLEQDEIQSLSLRDIVERKVRDAYRKVKRPVIVEDVGLSFDALHGLPGPFIKFFVERIPLEELCTFVPSGNRKAIASCVYGYFDGTTPYLFESSFPGEISSRPRGENGYGWDKIFIPDGYDKIRAELTPIEYQETYLRLKPLESVKRFLIGRVK